MRVPESTVKRILNEEITSRALSGWKVDSAVLVPDEVWVVSLTSPSGPLPIFEFSAVNEEEVRGHVRYALDRHLGDAD